MSESYPENAAENPETSPDKNEADESDARLALDKAIEAGYLTVEDVEEYLGVDAQDILTGVASYIEMAGDDAETVMKEWGLVEDNGEEDEV